MHWIVNSWKNLVALWSTSIGKKRYSKGDMFACHAGDYSGRFFVLIHNSDDLWEFLLIPDMKNIRINQKQVELGLSNTIIEHVQKLPRFVSRTVEKQFEENRKAELRSSFRLYDK